MIQSQQKSLATELFVAATAALAVHLLDRLWLHKETEETFDDLQKKIVWNVQVKTQESIQTLAAMNRSGMLQVYANREEAAPFIRDSLTDPRTDNVRLIGISLNDFISGKEKHPLRQSWKVLRRSIENGVEPGRKLSVQVLIIDPTCLGAQLRSRGEERGARGFLRRLGNQVRSEIDELMELQDLPKHEGVSFECRLYRLPPILFLCWTDLDCYVQQYYFWASRDDEEKSFPVVKFKSTTSDSLHSELIKHFDWIWEKASISLEAYRRQSSVGLDQGIVQSGITNVFTSPDESCNRMLYLLKHARKRVSLQGNSLHSFLNTRPEHTALYSALKKLLIDGEVQVDILILNPESHPARFRGYRESSLKQNELRWSQYEQSAEDHHDSVLYKDTTDAENALKELVKDVVEERNEPGWKPRLAGGKYDSAPYCFLLRVDNSILVEQYHYGKLADRGPGDSDKLGKEVPLVEYSADPSDIYDLTHKPPFELFVNHFEFAMRDAEPFDVDGWLGTNRRVPSSKSAVAP